MAQRYKLRLGDGTIVAVDQDGLKTWAHDGRAVAQAVGTQQWRPLQQVLAEEEAAARLARALVPPKPRQEATPPPPAPDPEPAPAAVSPPFELPAFGIEPPLDAPLPPSRPSLQVLADDPVSSRYAPAPIQPAPEDMPVIPMKPLDDEPVFQSAFSGRQEEDEEEPFEDEPRLDRLDGPLLTVLQTVGGFLSRCLDHLTPLAARLTSGSAEASSPRAAGVTAVRAPRKGAASVGARLTVTALAEDPVLPRWDEAEPRDEADRPALYARVSGWMSGLRARIHRPDRAEGPAPKREPDRLSPPTAPARQPVAAPTPLSELPALRFVESREPREVEDVYEGDEPAFVLRLGPVWFWTKRLVTTGALVAALGYAVVERDTWFPRTAELGQTVFTQIDQQVLSRERREQQQRALADASLRLPELAPETITLIFSRSPTGVVDPGEVFQIAREAADRGQAALTPTELEELHELARELLATLSRTEAERVREYDRTRARRVIFPFENPHVMDLVARGARALPVERRERLQALSHKAVAAGLDLPAATDAPSATR